MTHRGIILLTRCMMGATVAVWSLVVLNHAVPFAGRKTLSYTFGKPHSDIGAFRPWIRYETIKGKDGATIINMLEDPLYFDVKTPVQYKTARVEIVFQNNSKTPLHLGVRRSSEQFNIDTQPVTIFSKRDGWKMARAEFNLRGIPLYYQKYTFLVSVGGKVLENKNDDSVLLAKLGITLERDSIFQMLWKFLKKKMPQ